MAMTGKTSGKTRTSTAPFRVAVAGLIGLLVASFGAAPTYADTGGPGYAFSGIAGGTRITSGTGEVISDLTVPTEVGGSGFSSMSNAAAELSLGSVVHTGAVSTQASTDPIDGGYRVRTASVVDDLSALGGVVTATAVQTISVARVLNGVTSRSTTTTFSGLRVAGRKIPRKVAPNTRIYVRGVAVVVLNMGTGTRAPNQASTSGAGLTIDLLKPSGELAAGDTITVAPTTASLGAAPPCGHALYGHSFGTRVVGNPGFDETAPVYLPAAGTDGKTVVSTLAATHLTAADQLGSTTDVVTGTNTSSACDGRASAQVSGISLLNGAITADLVATSTHVRQASTATKPTVQGSATLQNLMIGGRPVLAGTAPNTTLSLGDYAEVVVNQRQRPNRRSLVVRALDITLTRTVDGFPAGTEIQVAVSRVAIS
jgi:hypothetical protein